MLILSGGEPLVRDDLGEIASYASGRGATVAAGDERHDAHRAARRDAEQAGVRVPR